jgi:hypothetical protein
MISTIIAIAVLLLAAYVGFKVLKFVASMVIKLVLFLLIMGVAAYFAFRMLW